ncbi:hypothetical protein [Sorangium sp. So ce124]|uniref:hypothetical protein n=1 Tax=Sorangium sp. So ce124 TaxID=3133280 RepID=UPI003F63ED57
MVYPAEGWPNVGRPGDPVVSVGGLFSYTGRENADDAVGAGVEGSFAWYGQGSFVWIGAVAQAQLVADRPVHERLALGFQGGFGPIGAELSMYTEGSGTSNARTYGAQIVPFIGLPIAYAGFRLALPFNEGNGATVPSYGTEYGLVIGLKFPINPRAFGHSLH